MPIFWSPERVRRSKAWVERGRARGPVRGPLDVTLGLPTFVGDDIDALRDAARQTSCCTPSFRSSSTCFGRVASRLRPTRWSMGMVLRRSIASLSTPYVWSDRSKSVSIQCVDVLRPRHALGAVESEGELVSGHGAMGGEDRGLVAHPYWSSGTALALTPSSQAFPVGASSGNLCAPRAESAIRYPG